MSRRFEGRRVLVAGGGSIGPGWGNGKAAAVLYADEGADVLVLDRNAAAAEETVDLIRDRGGRGEALAADLCREEDVGRTIAAMSAHGGLDVLHFNIGTSVKGGVADTSPEDWGRVFDINLTSAFLTTRAALPVMEAAGRGAIVYISSLAAIMAGPYSYASYEASKAALGRMAQSVAREYAPKGIRANVVLPGPIDTPHVRAVVAPGTDPEDLNRMRAAMVPMGRQGTAWDVAHAAAFLASDDAAFITGVLLPVDGGMSL